MQFAAAAHKMSITSKPPLPLPPGVMPSESRQDIVDLLGKEARGDAAEKLLREVRASDSRPVTTMPILTASRVTWYYNCREPFRPRKQLIRGQRVRRLRESQLLLLQELGWHQKRRSSGND